MIEELFFDFVIPVTGLYSRVQFLMILLISYAINKNDVKLSKGNV